MGYFVAWVLAIAVAAMWARSAGLDLSTRILIVTAVTCGPYWILFYDVLSKQSFGTVIWRSIKVWFLGVMLGGLVIAVLNSASSGGSRDEFDCTPGRYGDC